MFWSTSVWARDKNCKAGYMFCKAYSVFIALITLNKLVEKKRFQTELWLLQLNWMMPFCTFPILPPFRRASLCIQSMRWSPLHPIIVHSLYCIVSYCIDLSYLIIFHSSYLQWGWVDLFLPFVNTKTHFWAIVLGNILMLRIQSALCVFIEPLFWNIIMLWIEYQLYAIIIPLFLSVIIKLKCAMNFATID